MTAKQISAAILVLWIAASAASCSAEQNQDNRVADARAKSEAGPDPNQNSFFYRLTASYVYKPTGEPFIVDFVAGCNVEVEANKYTGSTARESLTPEYFITEAPGGAAVTVTAPVVCSNIYFERDLIPDDFLPELVWHDDPNWLAFGWAYASEDAYENPNTKLGFIGAWVNRATYREWKDWRAEREKNYRQVGAIPGPWGVVTSHFIYDQQEEFIRRFGGEFPYYVHSPCADSGYARFKLPDELIPKLRALAPEMDSRYWGMTRGEPVLEEVMNLLKEAGPVFENDAPVLKLNTSHASIFGGGRLRRNGGGQIDGRRYGLEGRIVGEFYPLLPVSDSIGVQPTEPPLSYPRILKAAEGWKGLLACGGGRLVDRASWVDAKNRWLRKNERDKSFDPHAAEKPKPILMNDDKTPIEQQRPGTPGVIIDWTGYLYLEAL